MNHPSLRDPVCGMPVTADSSHRIDDRGARIFFCSPLCKETFERDPSAFGSIGLDELTEWRPERRRIAYFTMEITLDLKVPTYAGGLGVLAGDTVRSFADLRVPVVAVTLLPRQGYFVQRLDAEGHQREEPATWEPEKYLRRLPVTAEVEIEGRTVRVGCWQHEMLGITGYRVPILFLDTNWADNSEFARSLTGTLYGGDRRYRLGQELVLGVGGIRILRALGCDGLRRFHLNEGHAALATLELTREANAGRAEADWRYADVRDRCVFTTHTPVAAGHDRFPRELVDRVLGELVPRRVLDMLGGSDELNMTSLALNLCGFVNGVARRHAETSEAMFPGYAVSHVTNGVHPRTWTTRPFASLYDEHLPGWTSDPALIRNAARIPLHRIWDAHVEAKGELLQEVSARTGVALDPDLLTIGFARRATLYKRADLVFSSLERLRDVARRSGGLQFVFAGKAHPQDAPAKEVIRRIVAVARALRDEIAVVYLPEYDTSLARTLVAGVDLWLNTPQRPLEASGTSGMKAALNGVPSFSVLDGWWLEGHVEGVTGWSIGPYPSSAAVDSASEAEDLYSKLALVIAPMFHHDREQWLTVMRGAISLNGSFFHTHRMVQQYVTNAYVREDLAALKIRRGAGTAAGPS